MPYIKQERRQDILVGIEPLNPGELNYMITQACKSYWDNISLKNYTAINDIIGALECAKQEFYRRVVIPYEDKKIVENGDVY